MSKTKINHQFKTLEDSDHVLGLKDEWNWEEGEVESDTKLTDDKGVGAEVIIRFFDFAANPEAFRQHKPTAQELFESHRKGIESLLWADGLRPYYEVEPRVAFSKDKTHYRIGIACLMGINSTLLDKPLTLGEMLHRTA